MKNKLFELYHVSGNEHKVRDFIKDQVKNFCDECYYDNFGNVIVRLKGEGKKVLFNTGIDTPGFLVTYVEESGQLRFSGIGNQSAASLADKFCISGEMTGLIKADKGAKLDELKISQLSIDLGCKDHGVKPGDIFALRNDYAENQESVFATHLSVKQNILILIQVIKKLYEQKRNADLYFAFTVQDQLGFKGAKVAANSIHPDCAVLLSWADCTVQDGLKWDGGTVIKIKDSFMIVNRPFREQIEKLFKEHQLPYQYEILASGGAYSSQVMYLQDGILTLGLSVPCKYHNSAVECVRKEELSRLQNALEILAGQL